MCSGTSLVAECQAREAAGVMMCPGITDSRCPLLTQSVTVVTKIHSQWRSIVLYDS